MPSRRHGGGEGSEKRVEEDTPARRGGYELVRTNLSNIQQQKEGVCAVH